VTITEALRITQSVPRDARPFAVTLACGFTPLHLQTFLAAHLQQALPGRRVTITPGLYGNLAGTLESISEANAPDGLVIALEWPDLDPRLDYRGAGSWGATAVNDIVASAQTMLDRIAAALLRTPSGPRIALSLPTLPLPPLFHTPGWQASHHELMLEAGVLRFAADIAQDGRIAVINPQRLAEQSPTAGRFDLKSDLYTGLPFTIEHADRLASQLAQALAPPTPKKGIISDLDDTLWSGIAGEVGPDAVAWDLASHAQLHGLYQKLLGSLADSGTLIGITSKNDPAVVAKAFERKDLLLRPEQVFPIEVHWNAKSGSVARILETWNIAADSVIFVDDSPMELAEVAAAHPGIECVLFPKNDYEAGLAMLRHLRDRCGKERVSKDDALRLESIRQGAAFREQASAGAAPESFLEQIGAVVTFDFAAATEPRVLELVNKTNQFNLNGGRYTQPDWQKLLSTPGLILAAVSYEDKFGPLGTIAAIAGHADGKRLTIDTWVMSCRAFARRIEHQTLKMLFETTGASEIEFRFTPTAKNGPLQDFFATLLAEPPTSECRLTRSQFELRCPALYHEVREMRRAEAHG
jgi:FkbH-like protein